MILEGLVTTLEADGTMHIAPMGPHVESGLHRFALRPFSTSNTYRNLKRCPEGVLHVVDDVLLLARAAIGRIDTLPSARRAESVRGFVLDDACRACEFRVVACDESAPRVRMDCVVARVHRQHDFFGFNRAMHAVVEAAILATRVHLLPRAEILAEMDRLDVLVEKTGGVRERRAFDLLREHVSREAP